MAFLKNLFGGPPFWGRQQTSKTVTILQAIADATNTALGNSSFTVWGAGMAGIDSLPAGIIGKPRGTRLPDRIGAKPVQYEVQVDIYSDLTSPASHSEQVELMEALVGAIDTDPTLAGNAEDAVVSHWDRPTPHRDMKRPMLVTSANVSVLTTI